MAISEALAEFTGAIDAAYADLNEVVSKISELEARRAGIVRTAPHTDDIVAVFLRGLAAASANAERHLKSYLEANFGGADSAASVSNGRASNLLQVPAHTLSAQERQDRLLQGKGSEPLETNVEILTYLLRDQIADEIPALVAKIFPQGSRGMKAADRTAALAEMDAELSELVAKRDELSAELHAARSAVLHPSDREAV